MQTSFYTIPVTVGEQILLFNSFTGAFLLISQARFEQIYSNGTFFLQNLSEEEKQCLISNGFLLSKEIDEREVITAARYSQRLQRRMSQIIINPTLDCNLACWYCYESHAKGSRMSQGVLDAICEYIKYKYAENKTEQLQLRFFGGEPLLAINEMCYIISFAKLFCLEKNIQLSLHFTTNGTILNRKLIDAIKDIPSVFQITIDGEEDVHNNIRYFKNTHKGTFSIIQRNVTRLLDELTNAKILLRINYTAQTVKNGSNSIQQLLAMFVPYKDRISVALHKVWQVNETEIDEEDLFDFIAAIKKLTFQLRVEGYSLLPYICYADRLESCVINYDGNVYKCTARDFKESNKCGTLNSQGIISWDYTKLREHCMTSIPQICLKCRLYPSCPGFCSQAIIENSGELQCPYKTGQRMEEMILMHYMLSSE